MRWLRRSCATHEAGHLIVAWCSGSVVGIGRCEVSAHEGVVYYAICPIFEDTPFSLWSRVVISVAGVTAELRSGYRVRPRDCVNDLVDAQNLSRRLARACDVRSAFPVDTAGRRAMSRMYVDADSPDVAHVLEAAYLKARRILRWYRHEHRVAALALFLFAALSGEEVTLLLGKREKMSVGRFELRRPARFAVARAWLRFWRLVWKKRRALVKRAWQFVKLSSTQMIGFEEKR